MDVHGYQVVVPLSESEISNVHVGQIATVTVEALEARKFAAHVVSLPVLATSSSGVVSYDVTFQLDQVASGMKPGMSATAEVVVEQAEGVNVPTSAISASSVTVLRGGKHVRQRVVTGLAGNSSTIVSSGLQPGETVLLPSVSTTSSSTSSLSGRRGSARRPGRRGSRRWRARRRRRRRLPQRRRLCAPNAPSEGWAHHARAPPAGAPVEHGAAAGRSASRSPRGGAR